MTSGGFTVTASGNNTASTSGAVSAANVIAVPKYDSVNAGDDSRTTANGSLTANFSSDAFSAYYDITVQMGVEDGSGSVQTGSVTYRVYNNAGALLNKPYAAVAANGNASLVLPSGSNQPILKATLVDASGTELPKNIDGSYQDVGAGYLKLTAANGDTVAIDEMDSQESASGWGFSHFFDLNDFFNSNQPSATGDTVAGSAFNLVVSTALTGNPSAIATGRITQVPQPTATGATPLYTYQRNSGDNSVAQSLANLSSTPVSFTASGGLSAQSTSLTAYSSEVIGSAATTAKNIDNQNTDNQTLLQGFQSQLDSLTGVNLDEELANTVIYQNSYAATARIITVVDQMMQDLVGVFQ